MTATCSGTFVNFSFSQRNSRLCLPPCSCRVTSWVGYSAIYCVSIPGCTFCIVFGWRNIWWCSSVVTVLACEFRSRGFVSHGLCSFSSFLSRRPRSLKYTSEHRWQRCVLSDRVVSVATLPVIVSRLG